VTKWAIRVAFVVGLLLVGISVLFFLSAASMLMGVEGYSSWSLFGEYPGGTITLGVGLLLLTGSAYFWLRERP
jgi:hypothetical protein